MAIKNVVFDFGGVLLDWNPRYLYKDVFNDDEKMEYFLNNVTTSAWNSQMDKGRPFSEAIKELCKQFPEFDDQIKMYKTHWPQMIKGTIPQGVELLNAVKQSGKYLIYGLTNWSAETFPVAYQRFSFLREDFEGIVVSGEEKMIKPEKGLFLTLFERYHLNPEECLFIDDNQRNIDTAKSRGMHTVLFDNPEEAKLKVAKILHLTL
ncbi:MAG: HAD family phosphatase [Succinivibrio sp.]|nr:HAD family phosphatase [Succinivibrio sp.]